MPIAEIDDAFFDEVMDLNVRSLVAACSAAVPHMRKGGRGNIINVTSIAARHGGGAGAAMYASAKGFVSHVHARPREGARQGQHPRQRRVARRDHHAVPRALLDAGDARNVQATIPMGRLGIADECVGAFMFLASDALSGYVTGQILEVNGGQYMP